MYSLLLMSAMAGTPDAAAFGGRRDAGCHGCTGAVMAASCYGGSCYGGSCYGDVSYGGCSGSSCYGSSCYGSSCHGEGRRGGLFGRLRGKKDRGASCHGSSCFGSSCYGSSCYGSFSHGVSCHGCGGVIVGTDVAVPVAPMGTVVPAAPAPMVAPATPAPAGGSASINVELPADAKLYVDGVLTTATGTVRQFHTPELTAGKAFYYEMKAEVVVGGKVEVETKRVVVQAGATLTESFPKLLAAAKTVDAAVAAR